MRVYELPIYGTGIYPLSTTRPLRFLNFLYKPAFVDDYHSHHLVGGGPDTFQTVGQAVIKVDKGGGMTVVYQERSGPTTLGPFEYQIHVIQSGDALPSADADWKYIGSTHTALSHQNSLYHAFWRRSQITVPRTGIWSCMWCGKGPFPDEETLEEHEDCCSG